MVFVLDRAGGGEVLKELCAEAVTQLGVEVSADAGQTAVLETGVSKTRFVATIKVSAEAQAKDGVLTRAASQAGLTINAYPKRAPRQKTTDKPTTTTPQKAAKA